MDLWRKIALALMLGVVSACHDTTAPAVPSNFILTTINGSQLPASYSLIPAGSTVVSGSLFLDNAGLATATEVRRDINGTLSTITFTYSYTIKNNVIQFDYYPGCPDLCIGLPKATLVNNHALVDFSSGLGIAVFDYVLGGDI